jgi:hypothetical protein
MDEAACTIFSAPPNKLSLASTFCGPAHYTIKDTVKYVILLGDLRICFSNVILFLTFQFAQQTSAMITA